MPIQLDKLQPGQSASVHRVNGGRGVLRRLEAMGVRPGKLITKVSSQFMGGPITVMIDGRYVAMGRGMAAKVTVEPRGN
ncbi:MAG: ferrous iron transport protein A [Candidatus Brocadiia bacterium]|nr:ferrous iron transport protein A [Planctomycetota bacterium]